MRKTNEKNNKGITLIALIITIIVMLILVSVTIAMAVNGGLFNYAGKAVGETQNAINAEQQLADGKIKIGETWYNSIDEYLGTTGGNGGGNIGETVLGEEKATLGNTTLTVRLLSTNVPVTADETIVKEIKQGAPIPADFYYVGGTMNEGIVISDSEDDENKGVDEDLVGNQFVWVPVAQNQRIEVEIKSDAEITELAIIDPLLEDITENANILEVSPSGTNCLLEIEPTINGPYTVLVTSGEETLEKKLRVASLFELDYWMDYIFTEETAKSKGFESLQDLLGFWSWSNGGVSIEDPYTYEVERIRVDENLTHYEYASSVNKYGGFYIARYEAGSNGERTSDESENLTEVYSKKNMYPYVYIAQADARTLAEEMYDGNGSIKSDLMSTAGYDRTFNWLVETDAITITEIVGDGSSWGNFKNSEFSFTGYYNEGNNFTNATSSTTKPENEEYLLGTGVSDYTKRNNIYDLAGNCEEWTPQTWGGNTIGRGYSFRLDPRASVVSDGFRTFCNPAGPFEEAGFRVALYLTL